MATIAQVLKVAADTLKADNPIPALQRARFDFADSTLTFTATDGAKWVTTRMNANGNARFGTRVILGRALTGIVKGANGPRLKLLVEGRKVHAMVGSTTYLLNQYDRGAFPELPQPAEKIGTISKDTLTSALRRVQEAAADEADLPVLAQVHIEFNPTSSTATLVATDRYCLAYETIHYTPEQDTEPWSVSLPVAGLTRTLEHLDSETLDLHHPTDSDGLTFSTGTTTFGVRAGGGTFPNWRNLLNGITSTIKVTTDAADLRDTVRRTSRITDDGGLISMVLNTPGEIGVIASDSEGVNFAQENIPCETTGSTNLYDLPPVTVDPHTLTRVLAHLVEGPADFNLGCTTGRFTVTAGTCTWLLANRAQAQAGVCAA